MKDRLNRHFIPISELTIRWKNCLEGHSRLRLARPRQPDRLSTARSHRARAPQQGHEGEHADKVTTRDAD